MLLAPIDMDVNRAILRDGVGGVRRFTLPNLAAQGHASYKAIDGARPTRYRETV